MFILYDFRAKNKRHSIGYESLGESPIFCQLDCSPFIRIIPWIWHMDRRGSEVGLVVPVNWSDVPKEDTEELSGMGRHDTLRITRFRG